MGIGEDGYGLIVVATIAIVIAYWAGARMATFLCKVKMRNVRSKLFAIAEQRKQIEAEGTLDGYAIGPGYRIGFKDGIARAVKELE